MRVAVRWPSACPAGANAVTRTRSPGSMSARAARTPPAGPWPGWRPARPGCLAACRGRCGGRRRRGCRRRSRSRCRAPSPGSAGAGAGPHCVKGGRGRASRPAGKRAGSRSWVEPPDVGGWGPAAWFLPEWSCSGTVLSVARRGPFRAPWDYEQACGRMIHRCHDRGHDVVFRQRQRKHRKMQNPTTERGFGRYCPSGPERTGFHSPPETWFTVSVRRVVSPNSSNP